MKHLSRFKSLYAVLLVIAFAMVGAFASLSSAGPSDTFVLYPYSADPCQNTSIAKSSVVITSTTSTNLGLVAATALKSTYICAVTVTGGAVAGSTFQLKSGTTTTDQCDTGTVNLTPAHIMGAYGGVRMGYGGMITKTTTSVQLCTTVSGSVTANVTYVKQ